MLSALPGFAAHRFLTLADIHYGSQHLDGDGLDTGKKLLALTLKKYGVLAAQADFIVILGDIPGHMFGASPKKEKYEQRVFHALYHANRARKPLFYAPGNNDALQGNYQSFQAKGKSPLTFAQEWQGACAYCDGLIIDASAMQEQGYYSSYVIPENKDIVLIVLNTTIFTKSPFYAATYPNQQEVASRQLQWFKSQLAKNKARQLLIAMHVPPGNNFQGNALWQEQYQQEFIAILTLFQHRFGQITLLTSHTHMDEIRKIRLNPGLNIYAYSTPSISRDHHNHSGMKLFELNDTWAVKDFTTYFTRTFLSWDDEHYHAIKECDSIFPQCQQETLAACLDRLDNETVCKQLETGLFYGVKSNKVHQNVCSRFYAVN